MTEPSAIATGPSGNRNPVAITRTSAIAPSSPQFRTGILSPQLPERQAGAPLISTCNLQSYRWSPHCCLCSNSAEKNF
jgi:hypothetical protein